MSTRFIMLEIVAVTLCCYFLFCPPAEAYFDLTTGMYLMQMGMAALASLWISMRYKWFSFIKPAKKVDEAKSESAVESTAVKQD